MSGLDTQRTPQLQARRVGAKEANLLYHDWEAATYDEKWSVSFDERSISYAREKFLKVAPERRYGKVLEIGAGTGFFVINLSQAGLVAEPFATDISPRMVQVCLQNAQKVGVNNIKVRTADAEKLPFAESTFDLVVGHAVLHHLPDVPAAFAEAFRVLKPGGAFVLAGEPTRVGHAIAGLARSTTAGVFRALGGPLGLTGGGTGERDPRADLEPHVDLHEFHPHMVRGWARDAGFDPVRVRTEELASALWGWGVRTIESLARPGLLGSRWAWLAYRSYVHLYRLDDLVLRRVLPDAVFHNLLMRAQKPDRLPKRRGRR